MGDHDMRKGWCPGIRRPMRAKDGLIVRLKIPCGIVPAAHLRAIAQAGRAFGNGLFELTSRANLQLRGVREEDLPHLIEILDTLGLVDDTDAAEAVRNVVVSPLAGLDGRTEALAAARELEAMLAASEELHALPAKFRFVIDDGSLLSLADTPADVRFDWTGGSLPLAVGIGGRACEAFYLGQCEPSEIPQVAGGLARAFLSLASQLPARPRRMRELIETFGASPIAQYCGLRASPARRAQAAGMPRPIGLLRSGKISCFGVAAVFGKLNADMLDRAAYAADHFGNGELRLSPWRALILPLACVDRADALCAYFAAHDFITDPADPRWCISACGGSLTCERGTADARSDALALMAATQRLFQHRPALHVSGCAKACGRPAAPLLVTACGDLYDLEVREAGLAANLRGAKGLTLAAIRDRLGTAAQIAIAPDDSAIP